MPHRTQALGSLGTQVSQALMTDSMATFPTQRGVGDGHFMVMQTQKSLFTEIQ